MENNEDSQSTTDQATPQNVSVTREGRTKRSRLILEFDMATPEGYLDVAIFVQAIMSRFSWLGIKNPGIPRAILEQIPDED